VTRGSATVWCRVIAWIQAVRGSHLGAWRAITHVAAHLFQRRRRPLLRMTVAGEMGVCVVYTRTRANLAVFACAARPSPARACVPSRSRAPASLAELCKPSQGSRAALLLAHRRVVRSDGCIARQAALHSRRQRARVERRGGARHRAGGRSTAATAAAAAPTLTAVTPVRAAVPVPLSVAASTAAAPAALGLTLRSSIAFSAPAAAPAAAAALGAGALVRHGRRVRCSARPSSVLAPTLPLRRVRVVTNALLPAAENVARFGAPPHWRGQEAARRGAMHRALRAAIAVALGRDSGASVKRVRRVKAPVLRLRRVAAARVSCGAPGVPRDGCATGTRERASTASLPRSERGTSLSTTGTNTPMRRAGCNARWLACLKGARGDERRGGALLLAAALEHLST
jgi:hypothetical protein